MPGSAEYNKVYFARGFNMVAWRAIIGNELAKDRLTVSSTTRRTC